MRFNRFSNRSENNIERTLRLINFDGSFRVLSSQIIKY